MQVITSEVNKSLVRISFIFTVGEGFSEVRQYPNTRNERMGVLSEVDLTFVHLGSGSEVLKVECLNLGQEDWKIACVLLAYGGRNDRRECTSGRGIGILNILGSYMGEIGVNRIIERTQENVRVV